MKTSEIFERLNYDFIETVNKAESGAFSVLDALLHLRGIRSQCEAYMEAVKGFEEEYMEAIANEAQKFGNEYKGFGIQSVAGRKLYNFANIPEVNQAKLNAQSVEQQYKSVFEAYQKGLVQTVTVNGQLLWIDENGEMKPFPELNYGKSFIQIKKLK